MLKKTDNGYLIETSELFRVFPPKAEAPQRPHSETFSRKQKTPMETVWLQHDIQLLREQLRDRQGTIDDRRHRLDRSDEERREAQARVIGLLAGPGPTVSKRGFFGRLFRRPDE